jgi:hypothetical protein
MMNDSQVDWQRLTETYSQMWDEELLELAADSADLTDLAREVLGNEMRKRGLKEPRVASEAPREPIRPPVVRDWEPGVDLPHGQEAREESDLPPEYTWKTPLCDCEDQTQAWQLREALRLAGIESWIEGPGAISHLHLRSPRVLVAADRLEAARAVAAGPIPQEIVEHSAMEVPEFEAPVCPKCGAEDPTLESVEPFNSWLCEACGEQWTETVSEGDDTEG